MKTAAELEQAFDLYALAIRETARPGAYWALLHVVVALPDVCGGLENLGTDRYIKWCAANFPAGGKLEPLDRYQLRNALLHQGTTLPKDTSRNQTKPTQYVSVSFVEPGENGADLHGLVQDDTRRKGKNVVVNIKTLADETWDAMHRWFVAVAANPARNAVVESNLPTLVRRQRKTSYVPVQLPPGTVPKGVRVQVVMTHPTDSST